MPTFFIHIGLNKTGSSALQRYFAASPRLAEANLAYAPLPGANHSTVLTAMFKHDRTKAEQQVGDTGRGILVEKRQELLDGFAGFLARTREQGLDGLVSGEAIPLIDYEGLCALRDFVRPYFDEIAVIGFLRPPLSFTRSSSQQRLKTGASLMEITRVPPPTRYRQVARVSEVFGRENLRIRVFHRDEMVDGCLLQTVLSMMGGDRSALKEDRAPRVNESMSLTAAKLFSELNYSIHEGALSERLPPEVAKRFESGRLAEVYRQLRPSSPHSIRLPEAWRTMLLGVPGPKFVLARGAIQRALKKSAPEVAQVKEILGIDLAAADEPVPDDAPTIEMLRTFSADEVERICVQLDRAATSMMSSAELSERHARRQERLLDVSLSRLKT